MTKVIYRKFKDGDIIALFPEIESDPMGNILSYMHVGQHGSANIGIVYQTKPATPEEYAKLHKELINIGYDDLNIGKRMNRRL